MIPLIAAGLGLAGSLIGANMENKNAGLDRALQKEFAQNKVQWTVSDAKKAGIHPLAALGAASSTSYQPVSNNSGSVVADGMAAAGAALSDGLQRKLTESYIERNQAETDQIRMQSLRIAEEARVASIGATTGAANVSDPSRSPNSLRMLGDLFGAADTPNGPVEIANMDIANDPESDLWSHVQRGDILPYVEKLLKRNMGEKRYDKIRLTLVNMLPALEAQERAKVEAALKKLRTKAPANGGGGW